MSKPMVVQKPLLIMYEQDGNIITNIWPRADDTHEGYGLLICDLVRHVARAFKVKKDAVWEWVDKERYHQTTSFSSPS